MNSRFEIAYVDYLFSGKYYFRINYLSNSSTGDITLTYKSVTNHHGALHVNYDYDVMTHLHFDGESLCNNLSFNNSYGPSFYKFILDVDTDDEDFYYLENQFCIKDTNGNIIDKYYFDSSGYWTNKVNIGYCYFNSEKSFSITKTGALGLEFSFYTSKIVSATCTVNITKIDLY